MLIGPLPPPPYRSTTPVCLNLRAMFGDRFRIGHDPAAEFEPNGRNDPWLMVIPCRYGEIFSHGRSTLCVEVHEGHGRIKQKIANLGCVTTHQDGDDGFGAFLFDVADFDAVAAIIQPRKRRHCHLTHEQREANAERLRPFRFAASTDQHRGRRTA